MKVDMVMDINKLFCQHFPNLNFTLKDFQKKVIDNVIKKNNTLCIMPTGGGKSVIYWLSGLLLNGITIIISPLIALIDEQSEKLKSQGYSVMTLHGGLEANKQIELLKKFYNKELNPNFIFVSPERIATDGFFEFSIKKRKDELKLLVIDEVHCVSQWGFDFRPFYKRIPDFLNEIFISNWPVILGLTATLNPKDLVEICSDFKIEKENILKDEMLIRAEIDLKVLKFSNEDEKEEKLWQLIEIHKNEKILIYLYRKYHKRGTEELMKKAISKGYNAINFHGDMSSKERQDIINSFKNNSTNLVFATNAFGMGIDIPDIRVVIHFMIPESVEQYYQEIGRAARDGKASNTYILYTNKNIQVRRTFFIDKSFPDENELTDVHHKITNGEKDIKTLQYFEDENIQKCLPYLINTKIIEIEAKGFSNLNIYKKINDKCIEEYFNSTRTKSMITTIKKNNLDSKTIIQIIYYNIANNIDFLNKPFDKCLIIKNNKEKLDVTDLNNIILSIDEKKEYKHNFLDYFVYLLDNYNSSQEFHQDIGVYLGIDKYKLKRIFKTLKGDFVRSKSEVIIANYLYNQNISYEYEKKLFYEKGKWIEPDFTITINNKEYYLEHLGMLGTESYDNRWLEKIKIYENFFKNKLICTYESLILSESIRDIIDKLISS
jgi:ATP-dependent DNA helicase RecQ